MTDLVVLTVLLIPLAWSGAVAGLRRLSGQATPEDAFEKYQLLIMVTPVLLGALWIVLSRLRPMTLPLPLPSFDDGGPIAAAPHVLAAATRAKAAINLRPWAMNAVLLAWLAGAAVRLVPLTAALLRLRYIAGRAERGEIGGIAVRLTEAPLPPLALGRATILLPAGLAAQMAPAALGLIVRHEQAHLRRKDPLYFAVLSLLDALLWFNPFLRGQTRRCRLAAELACDAAASGENPVEREAYARVLIQTLKHTAASVWSHAPAAISNVKSGDYRMRLNEIMRAGPTARQPKRRWLYLALGAALAPVAIVQFAWAQGGGSPIALPAAKPAAAASTAVFMFPVNGPITGRFGSRKDPKTGVRAFHNGIDIAAPEGTPVVAPANGAVGAIYRDPGDGQVVELNHANHLRTRYTHLGEVKVKWGDYVTAGQVIALSGNSGSSTGPHLHFEVRRNGKGIDPMRVLPAKAG